MKFDLITKYCKECGAPFKVLKKSKQVFHNRLCQEKFNEKRSIKKKHTWIEQMQREKIKKVINDDQD